MGHAVGFCTTENNNRDSVIALVSTGIGNVVMAHYMIDPYSTYYTFPRAVIIDDKTVKLDFVMKGRSYSLYVEFDSYKYPEICEGRKVVWTVVGDGSGPEVIRAVARAMKSLGECWYTILYKEGCEWKHI